MGSFEIVVATKREKTGEDEKGNVGLHGWLFGWKLRGAFAVCVVCVHTWFLC